MSEEQAKAFLDTATQALQSGQFAQALEFVQQSIALKADSSEAFVLRGIAHSQLGQTDDATTAFRQAIMLAPHNVKAYFNLAVHYYSLGQKAAAEEMAHEAIRIEPKHSGARDLLSRIQSESQGQAQPGMAPTGVLQNPDQPPIQGGAAQPVESAPMGGQIGAPPQNPYQSPAGPQYYRPGYTNPSVHSVAFIERMGKSWDSVGYVLGAVATVGGIVNLVRQLSMMAQYNWDLMAMSRANQSAAFGSAGEIMLLLISLMIMLMSLLWMIFDITDRRGNWLWLLPFVVCCCCTGLYGPIQLIYIWKGRD